MHANAASDRDAPPLAAPSIHEEGRRSDLVSLITPTFERECLLAKALGHVQAQRYREVEWLILDDSPEPTRVLAAAGDARVIYEHVDRRLSIGEKRNRLIERARGATIIQIDDDDYYASHYVDFMLDALARTGADMINLRGWFLYDMRARFFGYWDLMVKEGPHFRCDRDGVCEVTFDRNNNGALLHNHLGFGFTYAFRRQVWETGRFPDADWNEDGMFALQAASRFRLDGVYDTTGSCLHILHPGSTSSCLPQFEMPLSLLRQRYPAFAADLPE